MGEIEGLLNEIQSNSIVNSAVLISAKSDFILGADVTMLQALPDAETGYQLTKEGHRILDIIANSRKPIVAAIHGACLGGGLEVTYF